MRTKSAREIRKGIVLAWQVIRRERVGPRNLSAMPELTLRGYRHIMRYHKSGYWSTCPGVYADFVYPASGRRRE